MKKLITIILAAGILLSFTAVSNRSSVAPTEAAPAVTTSVATTDSHGGLLIENEHLWD